VSVLGPAILTGRAGAGGVPSGGAPRRVSTNPVSAKPTAALGPTGVPLYWRVLAAIRSRITSGELPPGSRIPSEPELIAQYGVSRTTVREAVGRLVQEGLLIRESGRGTFVAAAAPRQVEQQLGTLTGFAEDVELLGMRPGARVLAAGLVTLSAEAAGRLGLQAGAQAYRLTRVRLADDAPLSLETVTFPFDIGTLVAQEDPETVRPYALLERRYGVLLHEADQTIKGRPATPEETALLGMQPPATVLELERVTFDVRGRAVEHALGIYRADRYSHRIRLRRQRAGDPLPRPATG
jgi:GntR family transcriptional regulator